MYNVSWSSRHFAKKGNFFFPNVLRKVLGEKLACPPRIVDIDQGLPSSRRANNGLEPLGILANSASPDQSAGKIFTAKENHEECICLCRTATEDERSDAAGVSKIPCFFKDAVSSSKCTRRDATGVGISLLEGTMTVLATSEQGRHFSRIQDGEALRHSEKFFTAFTALDEQKEKAFGMTR